MLSFLIIYEAVRYGRVPKGSKTAEEQYVSSAEHQQYQVALEKQQLAMYDIILTVSQAHHSNCNTTDEKIKSISKKTFTLVGLNIGLLVKIISDSQNGSRVFVGCLRGLVVACWTTDH